MKKQKWLKKTAVMLLAGTMFCGTAAWTGAGAAEIVKAAAVTPPPVIDMNQKGSLEITKKDGSGKPLAGAGFTLYKVMNLSKAGETYQFTPELRFQEFFTTNNIAVDALGNYSAEEIEKLAAKLKTEVETNDIQPTKTEQITAEVTGQTTFKNLELGYYLVVETTVPANYIAGKPFLVAIPFTNPEGTDWVYNAQAVPKNYSTSIDKEINKGATGENVSNDGSVKVGDYVPYKITTRTPNYADEMYANAEVVFKITDVMSNGLKIVNDRTYPVVVKVGNTEIQNDDTKCTITAQSVTGDAADLTVVFNSDYLKKEAASNKDVEITYYAQVTTDAVAGTDANTNQPFLDYTNQPGVNPGHVPGPEVKVYTFDMKVMKFTKEGTSKNLAGADFQLYKASVEEGNKIGTVQTTKADGTISFEKMDEGIYYLVETKAPNGYTLLANPIKVEITAKKDAEGNATGEFTLKINDKEVNEGRDAYISHKVENTGLSYVAVENHKGFNIPMTGGMGIALFLAVGAAGIVVISVLLVKKNKDVR